MNEPLNAQLDPQSADVIDQRIIKTATDNRATIVGDHVTKIVAGTNVTISPTTGIGEVTVNADPTVPKVNKSYSVVDASIAVDNVVSLLEAGTYNVLYLDYYSHDVDLGRQNNINYYAVGFVAPITMAGFTISGLQIKTVGSPADNLTVDLLSHNSTVPNAVIEQETITNASLSGAYSSQSVTFASTLNAGSTYWIAVKRNDAVNGSNYYQIKAGQWNGYFMKAGCDTTSGTAWTDSVQVMINFNLSATITGGLYRTLDVPNNVGLQGGIVGLVSAVAGGNATITLNGVHTAASSAYTAGNDYFVSATTPGAVATTGNCSLGRAESATTIRVPSFKRCVAAYTGTPFVMTASSTTATFLTGFRPAHIRVQGAYNPYSTIGHYDNGSSSGIKIGNGYPPSVVTLWDYAGSGSGSGGSSGSVSSIGKSNVVFSIGSTANSPYFAGEIECEN